MSRGGLNTFDLLASGGNVQLGSTGSADALSIPARINLYDAEFSRTSDDLVVQSDGQSLIIVDYFAQADPQDLMAPDKGVLRGEIVEILAGSAGDTRLAQTTPGEGPQPIGQVEVAEGSVRVQRTDGSVEQLDVGAKIYQQDVLISDVDGNLSVTFADGTIFTLSASSRMVVDELIYDPEGPDNSGAFSLVQGGFVFVAGQVAKTGNMTVDTPAATMGIRGTNVSAEIVTVGGETEVQLALNRDYDGTIGSIEVFVDDVLQGVITATNVMWVISSSNGTVQEVARTATDLATDQELIDEAYEAYLAAEARVEQGENYVELGDRSGSNRNTAPSDNQFNDLPDGGAEDQGDADGNDGGQGDDLLEEAELLDAEVDNQRNPPDAPVASDVTVSGPEDTSDTDPIEGEGSVSNDNTGVLSFSIVSAPQNGVATMLSDGSFTYVPNPDFSGTDSFVYSVTNELGGVDTATVVVHIAPVNDAPIATGNAAISTEDTPVTIDPVADDTDIDGDTLSVAGVSLPSHGTVEINPDGTLTYTPDPDYNGPDNFTYTVEDGQGGSDTAAVSVTITPVNDAPVATDDARTTDEDQPIVIDVLSNDSDVDADPLAVSWVSVPANGTVNINPDGTVTYTPDAKYHGADSFTYVVSDGQGGTDTGTVDITVNSVNEAPVAQPDILIVGQDTAGGSVTVVANDLDGDGDALNVTGLTTPQHGTASSTGGTVSYTPDAGYFGLDSFQYEVSDGNGGADSETVTVVIEQDPNSLPPDFPVTITFDPDAPGGNVPGSFAINVTSVATTSVNLVFALDSSGSLTQADWNQQVAAVRSAITQLASDFDGSQTDVDVFIINYASSVQTVGKFDLLTQTPQLLTAIDGLEFQSGGTNWESALNAATDFFSAEPSDEVNIMYFITDGNPTPEDQDWPGALANLNATVSVDIEAFAIGQSVAIENLNALDSDGTATQVTNADALAGAFGQTPLFNAQLVDFSLQLIVDGLDHGEIANEDSPSLTTDGLNFNLDLDDIPGLDGLLGGINIFAVNAVFDMDGDPLTLGDQVEMFSVGTLTAADVAGVSATSADAGAPPDLIPMALTIDAAAAEAPPGDQTLQGVLDLSGNDGNLPTGTNGNGDSGSGAGGLAGPTGFGEGSGGLLSGLGLDGTDAPSLPSA